MVDGQVHHFSCGGLYDGQALLIDDETQTYWDHVTGEALHGPLAGRRLPWWSLPITTVEQALSEHADTELWVSQPSFKGRFLVWFFGLWPTFGKGMLPFFFRKTMGRPDTRLPEMDSGLAVVVDDRARFYPVKTLRQLAQPTVDKWGDRTLRVEIGPAGLPGAVWEDSTAPKQLMMRFYGFAYTWPGGEIFGHS